MKGYLAEHIAYISHNSLIPTNGSLGPTVMSFMNFKEFTFLALILWMFSNPEFPPYSSFFSLGMLLGITNTQKMWTTNSSKTFPEKNMIYEVFLKCIVLSISMYILVCMCIRV